MKISTTINRLLKLAQFLRELPRCSFDMQCWIRDKGRIPDDSEDDRFDRYNCNKIPECGMAACLGGWATHIVPELVIKKGGLHNTRTGGSDYTAFGYAFGLDGVTAEILTDGDADHKTPKQAAKVLEELAVEIAKANDYEIVQSLQG